MAEGYVTTSAVDANDLLNQICSQAVLHGWTQEYLGPQGLTGRRGHLSKGGVAVNLGSAVLPTPTGSDTNAVRNVLVPNAGSRPNWQQWGSNIGGGQSVVADVLGINAGSGFDWQVDWDRQPGVPFTNGNPAFGDFSAIKTKGAIGRVFMFFYENPSMFFVVVEAFSGYWQWLCAGSVDKDYEFGGGQFYGASLMDVWMLANSAPRQLDAIQVRIVNPDVDAPLGNGWGGSMLAKHDRTVSPSNIEAAGQRVPQYWVAKSGPVMAQGSDVIARAYDEATGRLWLNPVWAYAMRPNSTRSYIGSLKHAYYCTVSKFPGADLVSLGGDEYMIFPANFRPSPYDPEALTGTPLNSNYQRASHYGSGFALRRPA